MSALGDSVRLILRYKVPAHAQSPIYDLAPASRIGRGSKRDCYPHPDHPHLCVKVARRPHRPSAQQASIVEWFCARSLDKRGVDGTHRARCLGWVATNYGPGLVAERIYNDDGTPATTLYDAHMADGLCPEQIRRLFGELKTWVVTHGVPITDLNPGNLLVQRRDDTLSLVLVDGIGGQKVKFKFVLYRRFVWFARAMSRRRWARLQRNAERELYQSSTAAGPNEYSEGTAGPTEDALHASPARLLD